MSFLRFPCRGVQARQAYAGCGDYFVTFRSVQRVFHVSVANVAGKQGVPRRLIHVTGGGIPRFHNFRRQAVGGGIIAVVHGGGGLRAQCVQILAVSA